MDITPTMMLRSSKKRKPPDEPSEHQCRSDRTSKRTTHSVKSNLENESGKFDNESSSRNSKRSRTNEFQQSVEKNRGSEDIKDRPNSSSHYKSKVLDPTSESKPAISDKETSFLRLCYFISKPVTKAARDWFQSKYPRSKLMKKQKKLRKLMEKPHLVKLFRETSGEIEVIYEELDISAIVAVCRGLSDKNDISDWMRTPQESNYSAKADLLRILEKRNEIAHSNTAEVENTKFNDMWKTLREAVSRLSKGRLDDQFDVYRNIPLDGRHLMGLQIQRTIPQEIRNHHVQNIRRWTVEDEIFVETRYYSNALNLLQSAKVLLIVGGRGTGKTALARHLALEISNRQFCEIVPANVLEQVMEYRDVDIVQIFLLDDIFDSQRIDTLWSSWLSSQDAILKSLRGSKIIFTCKPTTFQKLSLCSLGNIKAMECVQIDAPNNSLKCEEKFKILEKHCIRMNVDDHVYKELSLDSHIDMFPYLCEVFSKRKDCQILGQTFFDQPYVFLKEDFDTLRISKPLHYASLVVLLMQVDRRLSYRVLSQMDTEKRMDVLNCCSETPFVTDFSIMQALRDMLDEYTLERRENEYVFKHDNIAEMLARHFGSLFPKLILKHMSTEYISNSINVGNMFPESIFTLNISNHDYNDLVQRLFADISSRNPLTLCDVFSSKCLQSPEFLDVFIKKNGRNG